MLRRPPTRIELQAEDKAELEGLGGLGKDGHLPDAPPPPPPPPATHTPGGSVLVAESPLPPSAAQRIGL